MRQRITVNCLNLMHDTMFLFRNSGSRCFPRFIKRPYPRSDLQDIRHTDPKQNVRHNPPKDEYIELCSVWAIEFYTPAHMDGLLSSFERLGWTEDDTRNPVDWLKHRQASKYGQAWMSLGPVIPRAAPNPYVIRPLRADLPANVTVAFGDIYCFTPSLIAIAFEFTFDEEYSRVFDDALRRERESYVTRIPSGYRIHDPGNQRIAHINMIRRDTARLITEWFSQNIPGLCATGLLEDDFPTCEFVTFRKAQPFPTREECNGEFQWYMHDLGMSSSHSSWESKRMPALRFYPSPVVRNTIEYHSILSINETSWKNQQIKDEDFDTKESRIYDMHRNLSGLLAIWAVDVMLQGYARHFRDLRNSEILRFAQHKSTVEVLQRVGENVSYSVDIAAVTEELVSLIEAKRSLWYGVESFKPRSDVPDYWWQKSLEELIHKQIGENAKWLQSVDIAVRDHLTQYGTILGLVENVRLQKKISRFTCAILVLTLVLSTLTVISAAEQFAWVKVTWNAISEFLRGWK